MRFNVTVASEEQETNHVRVSAPDSSGVVTIEGLRAALHRGGLGAITNTSATGGERVGFRADEDGIFSVTVAASVGDVLEFHGDHCLVKLFCGSVCWEWCLRIGLRSAFSLSLKSVVRKRLRCTRTAGTASQSFRQQPDQGASPPFAALSASGS